MRESAIIELIQQLCAASSPPLLGIGDDCAAYLGPKNASLICTDMLMDGVHFLSQQQPAEAIGYKSLAVNLSDIAAMGGKPLLATVALALPKSLANEDFLRGFYAGLAKLSKDFQCPIIGGDSNIWQGPLVCSVTVVGEAHAKGLVTRSGARPGDKIIVTGPLGGSLEQHHLHFRPRLDEAQALMNAFRIHSMIDLSDGLAKDLAVIAEQSGVGALVEAHRIPLRPNIQNLPPEEKIRRAFCDGEDFELCFTLSTSEAETLLKDPNFSYCHEIGTITAGKGLALRDKNKTQTIHWKGYEH